MAGHEQLEQINTHRRSVCGEVVTLERSTMMCEMKRGFFFFGFYNLLILLGCLKMFRESHPGVAALESGGVQFDSRGAFHKQPENR